MHLYKTNKETNKRLLLEAINDLLALEEAEHTVMGMAVAKLENVLGDLYNHTVRLTASRPVE